MDSEWVRIERTFDATIETVWKMWADPKLFAQWYGPSGMTIPTAEMDVTVGGKRKICMQMMMPDRTMTMWLSGTYLEVTPPTRLVYTESMSDAEGNVLSPQSMGMPEGHPEVTHVSIELSESGGKTHMILIHQGVPRDSQGAGGWQQAIKKMADLLASI